MQFYEAKVEELGNNLKDLEVIVQRKQTNVRTIEEGKFDEVLGQCGQVLTFLSSVETKDYGVTRTRRATSGVMIFKNRKGKLDLILIQHEQLSCSRMLQKLRFSI